MVTKGHVRQGATCSCVVASLGGTAVRHLVVWLVLRYWLLWWEMGCGVGDVWYYLWWLVLGCGVGAAWLLQRARSNAGWCPAVT